MLTAGEVRNIFALQKSFFNGGFTHNIASRRDLLERLCKAIRVAEPQILQALHTDLGKSTFEAYVSEISATLDEIQLLIKNLSRWSKPRRVSTSILNFPASGKIIPEPFGLVLIFSAWNYPFQLLMCPLAGAIAAGNCVIAKPSEHAPATAEVIHRIINEVFSPQHTVVLNGDNDLARKLLSEKFDYIFFTGGEDTGRTVMQAAALHLTPVTLELGGKSPCIIEPDANIELAGRRIAWGKFLNAGQTCVAPDYLFVHHSIIDELVESLKHHIWKFYGSNPEESPDYGRIINEHHFRRLLALINPKLVYSGGRVNAATRYIEPTIILNPKETDPIMEEEIFGPLLPVIEYSDFEDVIEFINARSKPLAMYYFSRRQTNLELLLEMTSSGSVCINDTVLQVTNPSMPFGGIGGSGMGAYHGKYTFDTFTHLKPVMKKANWFDFPLRYPPFAPWKLKLFRSIKK
jgi:aldehyde dehydrogenase (NAD+)